MEDLATDGERLWIAAGERLLTFEGGVARRVNRL